MLFPQRIDEDIAEDDPVRIIDAVLDGIDAYVKYNWFHKEQRPRTY